MSPLLVVLIAILFVGTLLLTALLLGLPIPGLTPGASSSSTMRNLVRSQRDPGTARPAAGRGSVRSTTDLDQEEEKGFSQKRKVSSALTLEKRLRFAQWKLPPLMFRLAQAGVSMLLFSIAYAKLNVIFQIAALLAGPVFVNWLLNLAMDRRFKAFDKDYPSFLLSLVALLKTGMNAMGALEAASEGLEEGSLVREEVLSMIERLRLGVQEDKAIGAFGEDIFHPEIELFVQALLLSRRVGGTLSDTLERLARQVRKRQFFRASANSAVGMQRGSIWVIIGILFALEFYLYKVYPQAVTGAFQDEMGWQVWQVGIFIILCGIFWVRQVTKIRV